MREDLLGYLLGAMEPEEQREFERRLEVDAELRNQWQALQQAFSLPGGDQRFFDPPSGLARRTCELVAQFRAQEALLQEVQRAQEAAAHASEPQGFLPGIAKSGAAALPPGAAQVALVDRSFAPGDARSWRLADYVTVAGITLAASLLLFPVLASWRYQQHVTMCREKLHRLGNALVDYSRIHGDLFPEVAESGPLGYAGVYAPRLREAKLITDAADVICPGTMQTTDAFHLPTLAALQEADPEAENRWAQQMGGGYGYALGYLEDGVYHPLRNRSRATFAVLADAPRNVSLGSLNHGCGGQNVLFEDGHAAFLNNCRLQDEGDQLFHNNAGFVGAGIGPDDVVIGTSEARPLRSAPATAIH